MLRNTKSGAEEELQQIDAIIKRINRRIEKNPQNLRNHLLLARRYLALGIPVWAEQEYQGLINSHPEYIPAYIQLAKLYLLKREFQKAQSCLDAAHKIDPENYLVHYQLSVCYYKQQNLSMALRYISHAIHYAPAHKSLLYSTRADIYTELGQHESALEDFYVATKHDHQNIDAMIGIAETFVHKAEEIDVYDEAKEFYDRAQTTLETLSKAYPKEARVFLALGDFYCDLAGRYSRIQMESGLKSIGEETLVRALEYYFTAKLFDPRNHKIYLAIANIHRVRQDYHLAKIELEKAHQLAPSNSEILQALIETCLQASKYDACQNYATKYFALFPGLQEATEVRMWMAEAKLKQGLLQDAENEYREIIRQNAAFRLKSFLGLARIGLAKIEEIQVNSLTTPVQKLEQESVQTARVREALDQAELLVEENQSLWGRAEIIILKAKLSLIQKKGGQALDYCQEVIELDDSFAEVYVIQAQACAFLAAYAMAGTDQDRANAFLALALSAFNDSDLFASKDSQYYEAYILNNLLFGVLLMQLGDRATGNNFIDRAREATTEICSLPQATFAIRRIQKILAIAGIPEGTFNFLE